MIAAYGRCTLRTTDPNTGLRSGAVHAGENFARTGAVGMDRGGALVADAICAPWTGATRRLRYMVKWDGGPRRPAREYPAEEREIRFFFDYGCDWPLWEDGTEEYEMTPEDYDLSPELVALLRRCQALWEATGPFGSQPTAVTVEEFHELCTQAVAKLRTEVYPIKVRREE